MATNDFDCVGEVLSEDFTLEWPQSNERIRGATRFAFMFDRFLVAMNFLSAGKIADDGLPLAADVSRIALSMPLFSSSA